MLFQVGGQGSRPTFFEMAAAQQLPASLRAALAYSFGVSIILLPSEDAEVPFYIYRNVLFSATRVSLISLGSLVMKYNDKKFSKKTKIMK